MRLGRRLLLKGKAASRRGQLGHTDRHRRVDAVYPVAMRSAIAPKVITNVYAGGSRLQGAFGLEGRVSLSVVTMPAATWELGPDEEHARGECP